MANNPYVNKVQYGNTTLIDLTSDTVTADKLMQGYTAHDRTGAVITGTATGGSGDGYVWQDAQGYVHLSDNSSVQHTATITTTGAVGGNNMAYVRINNVSYYTAEDTFVYSAGDSLYCYAESLRGSDAIYVDDASVASGAPAYYTYTLPDSDITIELRAATTGSYVKIYTVGGAVIQPLSITQNGTYTAPSGVDGYSPITASVPNSYPASDEGKVVSNGALVSQTSATYTTNNTYDTTLINSVTVSVSGSPSATSHTIYFEFSDNTNTTITGYWDDSFISNAITATTPTTYGQKTVTLAQLDGVTWYEPAPIPLNTQLIDYSAIVAGYIIDASDGQESASQWSCCSDFTKIDPSMTFSFVGYQWYAMAFYDASKTFISGIQQSVYADTVENDYAHGTLSGARIPSNAVYVRLSSYPNTGITNAQLSLIRTA